MGAEDAGRGAVTWVTDLGCSDLGE